jgi:opacity protein-like surface antigen
MATIGAQAAGAQVRRGADQDERATPPVEVTPFVSMGSIGSSRVGAAVAFPMSREFMLEMEVGYRNGDGASDTISSSLNLIYELPAVGRVRPYAAGGVGLEETVTAIDVPGRGVLPIQGVTFTLNAGGGVKVPIDDRWAVRSDARWAKSFGRHGGEKWRLYNGVTLRR